MRGGRLRFAGAKGSVPQSPQPVLSPGAPLRSCDSPGPTEASTPTSTRQRRFASRLTTIPRRSYYFNGHICARFFMEYDLPFYNIRRIKIQSRTCRIEPFLPAVSRENSRWPGRAPNDGNSKTVGLGLRFEGVYSFPAGTITTTMVTEGKGTIRKIRTDAVTHYRTVSRILIAIVGQPIHRHFLLLVILYCQGMLYTGYRVDKINTFTRYWSPKKNTTDFHRVMLDYHTKRRNLRLPHGCPGESRPPDGPAPGRIQIIMLEHPFRFHAV